MNKLSPEEIRQQAEATGVSETTIIRCLEAARPKPRKRKDHKLKTLIKKAVSTQFLANQRVEKATGKIIEALGLTDHGVNEKRPRHELITRYQDDVAHLRDTIEYMAELMAKGEFKLDSHAVDCIRNIAPPYGH